MKKVLLTTGGTGGHIYPALAVADNLREKGVEVLFVGTKARMEKEIVPKRGYRFIGLDIPVPKGFKNIIIFFKAIKTAYRLLKKEKPDAIVGFGNYISVPVILAGILQGKKIYLQEQNANIGFANKIFYKFAKLTFLAFEKTYDDIPIKYQNRFKVIGNPLRVEIEGLKYQEEREKLGIAENERLLLVTGGSLGAQEINNAILKNWDKFLNNEEIVVYWATGYGNYEEIKKQVKRKKQKDEIKPYFDNMLEIMAASDLVICRAGALTISELIELERPSILIPYSSMKVGQYENAKILLDNKSAYVYTREQIDEAIEEIFSLIRNNERLKKMRVRIKSLKKSNSAETLIANLDIWRS
ncbi:MAG: undecaprenyldiphospho-muramoylpentapeptide beta-N-acetylglucosaminyltransferase [Fusobacterium sp.]|uniref:undecaprenyldiphospho-muramoylpentapeptide beta-N-acetylglucosaminyltransferase n=1 Tax=Fusobacterium sp. TaxID=68766 RepID=UPI0026DD17F5|nr:undecaprenyldiphospho-muramoylpentapeptide beta-N-acetylglucosaminyltransferase [Fusobacterium sp.]MDO4690992.1 undecaprenyldiphospho-muramoylpentapeptide beta-N-acetylglucosaminyltransferase [Fusobacterium sp.]